MKKLLKTGKKTLSVIMAVMMVLSAWVWVAPEKASAAAGTYTVVIKLMIADNYDMENSAATIKVSYYGNNGSDSSATTSTSSQFSIAENSLKEDDCTRTFTISNCPGYPAAILFGDAGFKSNNSIWNSHLNVEVTVNGTTVYNDKPNGGYTFNVGAGKTVGNLSLSGDSDWSNNKPYANTITWSNTPEAMTCPKTGSTTQTVAASAKDQYGVQMYDPSWSVTSDRDTSGLAVSSAGVITVTNATNVDSGSYSTQTGKVTATWGSKSETKNFTITDSYYTATFNYKSADGSDTSATRSNYHGSTITAPTATDYDLGDNHYVFGGWSPNFSSAITKDVTYIATYTSKFVEADYSAVNEAIAAANAIKAQYGTEYELKYTLASRVALDTAINAVVTGLGRTRQSDVDGFAAEINAKIAALEPNKFDVIFLDKDGAILLYEKDVEYKEAVTAPVYNASYYDATNHYTFTGWDTDEYTSVVDDLVIQPVFTAEGHTYTTETVTSNCVTKGATKYTCSCGYSYIDGESDYGDHVWATEFTTDLEPTCTVAGSKSFHCTLCDAQKDITEIPPLGHQWSSQSVAVEATCGKIGIMAKVCDDCGVCEHTIIDALEHDFEEKVVAPTCTTKGYTEYTCKRDNCGYSYRDNYTDVVAHSYGDWETVSDAYCGVEGVKKQTCTECGYVNLGSIDALEHNLSGWTDVVAQTCTGKGYQVKTCSLCGNVIEEQWLDALGHNYVEKTVVAPTCESKGYTVEECNRAECGAQRIVAEKTALNHAWTSTNHAADCTHSAYIEHVCANDASHNYIEYVNGSTALLHDFTGTETIISPATCTADGKKTVECTRCDATTEEILPKSGHSYGEWDKTTNPATNDKDGTWTRKCENCGDVETLTVPKGGHNLVEDEEQYVAPLCNTKGQRVYECDAHENCTVKVTVELDYAQHTVTQKEIQATCTTPGSVEAYCSVCGASFKTTETPVKAHNPVAGETVAPTCTTSGYTVYACACGTFSYNEYDASKPATGHSYEASTTPATCTATGLTTYTCACGETYTETIPATGHSYTENASKATEATCTTLATKTYECSCGASYVEYYGALAAHVFDELVKTVPATNDSLGYEERKCDCGLTEITILEATGTHVFNEKLTEECVAPTCTENGTDVYKCTAHTDCGAKSSVLVPRLGHTVIAKYTAPTCIAAGSSEAYCTTCNTTVATTVIPAIGYHNFSGEGVTADATCTQTGSITYTCLTDGCNATKVETIPAKGHYLTTTVTDAKCGEKGSVVTECKVCNDPSARTTHELAAKGHIWGEYTVEKNASCTEDGKKVASCTNADCTEKNEIVIPKLGHSWSAWVKTDATTAADGKWERTCATCGTVEALAIPRGHSLVKDTANSKAATCSAEGKEIYICEAHTDCGVKLELTLPKLQHTVAQREIQATCDEEGKVEAYCLVCNDVLSTEAIPVKAHSYEAQTEVAPTCTTSGYTPYKCSSCGDTYNAYDASKPATGHNLVEGTSTASCTEDGEMTLTCACGYATNVKVPALGHNYVENTAKATSATCAAPATKTYECSHNNCDDSYTIFTGAKTNEHVWGGWVVKEAATPSSLGYQTAECTVCGQLKVETIPATGEHNFNTEIARTPATCEGDGSVTYKCSTHTDCGLTTTVTLPKLGHTESLKYTPASCEGAGSAKLVCSVCDVTIDSVDIPALGHAYGDAVVKNATCNTEGELVYTCTVANCGATKKVSISKNSNAHQYVTTVTDSTCYGAGSVLTKCSLCGEEAFKKALPMIEHTWNDGVETTKATCEKDGEKTYTCTVENCGATKTETVAKLGHEWGEWTVVPSTNTDVGSVTRTCSRGCTDTVEIPAGNHKLVVDDSKSTPASCKAEGELVYICGNHDNCGITVTVTTAMLQHTPETETVDEVTCDTNGKVVTSCTECDAILVETIIPATGHNYKGEVTKKATCTEEGTRTFTCAHDANHTYTEAIAKLQHNYVAGEAVEATCTSSGYIPYKCACGSEYVRITENATGHTLVEGASTATCTEDGEKTLTCACGYSTKVKVPALGHDYVLDSTTNATCAAAATETYKCSRCEASYTISVGDKVTDHTWGAETVVDATNTSLGYKTRTCTVCGQVYFEIIPATGEHNFNVETADKLAPTCTVDGYIVYACSADHNCNLTSKVTVPATGHKEKISYKAPTCTEDGYTKIICEVADCDYEKDATTIPALGHIWVQKKLTPATCNSKGSIEYSCKNCTETYTVEFENKDAHNFETITVLASCDAEGSVTVTCSNGCGYTLTTTLPKLGHDWGDWEVKTPATNTKNGEMMRECSNGCVDTCVIPAGGHEWDNGTVTKDATCNETGTMVYKCTAHADCGITITVNTDYAEHTYKTDVVESCSSAGSVRTYCTVCGDVFANITLGLAQHTYDKGVETAPTCTSSGYTLYTCTKCGHTYKEIGAAPVGHEIVKSESKANCTTGDTIVISCKNCDFKQEVEVPALGHDYRLNSKTDATCEAAATETYKCSRCEASYTISVGNKTDSHEWNDWEVVEKASYTSLGYEIRTCKICGKLEVSTIPATGDHVFDKPVSETAPDCENDGEKVYACSVHTDCGFTSVVTVPATGHKEKISYKAPTCTQDGYSKIICEVEGCTYEKDETPIPATGHVYGNGEITAAATCKTAGNIRYTCSCGDVMNAEIPVDTSAHNFDTDIQQASCTADGKVTVTCLNGCDYKEETVIPAKGHTFTGEKVTVSNATCTDDGEMTVKCVNCDEVDKVVIPKSGHSMKAGAAVAPTCTTSGYTPYTCGNAGCDHGYNVYDGTKPAKGHTWGGWTIVTAATKDSEGLKRRSCTVCSNATEEQIIPAMKHELTVLENVASTCTKAGHITYKCVAEHDGAACDFTFIVDLPVKQHTLSTAVNDATCVAEGSVVTECTVPGCGYNIVTPIPAIAHKLGTSEHYPSCTDKGYTKVYCENSYCDYEVISEIAPLGHNYDDSIEANVEVVKDATCTQEGLMTVKCSRAGCNEVKEVVIPKLNHVFKEEKTVNATCTESGYILMKCENCTETYNEFVSDPKGHNWNDGEITKPATCTENGEITYTCTNDAKHTYTQPIAKLGHDWGEWKVTLNPTATVEGIQSRECKVCHTTENATIPALGGTTTYTVTFIADGKTVATQIVIHNGKATAPEVSKPYDADYHYSYIWDTDFSRVTSDLTVTAIFTPAAHSYGEWVVDNAASCDNEGLRHRSCACGYVQYETLESTEHSFIVLEGGVPATCTENGFERVECEICHKTEERVLKRLGHVMTYHQAIDPTCDEDGVAGHYSCSRCAKNFKDRAGQNELDNVVVSKRYHTFIVVPGNEATCTKDGTTDYMYCTVCGYNRISETIPAFGHSDANNDGTCDNCGSTYMQGGSIVCSCSCHKNGFFNELIYKILSFFWRLFGMNKSCECGKVHY